MLNGPTQHCLLVPKNQHQYEFFCRIQKTSDHEIKFSILDMFNFGKLSDHFIIEAPIYGGSARYQSTDSKQLLPKNLNKYIYSDREVTHFPRLYRNQKNSKNLFELARHITCQVDNVLSEQKFDFVFGEFITGIVDGILFEKCKDKGIPYFSIRQSKISPGIIVGKNNSDSPFVINPKADLVSADAYIEGLRTKYLKPTYLEKTAINHRITVKNFDDIISRFRFMLKIKSKSRFRHIINPLIWAMFKLKNRILLKFKFKNYFYNNVNNIKNYIVFPLHYEPEASVTIRGFPYDQLDVIKYISRSLPPHMTLVVKEHKGNRGYRPIPHYKEIADLHNTMLVSPEVETYSLIKNADAITTFSGRMGMEAAILGKPVFLFGDAFYKDLSTVKIVERLTDLTPLFDNLDEISNQFDFCTDKKKLLSYCEGVFDGNFVMKSKTFMTDENVEKILTVLKLLIHRGSDIAS